MACPVCSKPSNKDSMPFCSDRCKTLDLGKWLDGSYSVPVVEDEDLPDDFDMENSDNIHH